MAAMERASAVAAGLGSAAVFESLAVVSTQVRSVRAASPWQQDPYNAVVGLAQVAVPMLGLVILLRLLAWRAPGGPDRERQVVRAAGAMTALVGLALAFEWAAVGTMRSWAAWTWALAGGLVVASVCAVVAAVLLARCRGTRARWRHDWLGDVLLVGRTVPALRRWATADAADWVRRRAMTVFVLASALAAAGTVGAMVVGERWSDPLLIGWALIAQTTTFLAFCVISNAVAGFIARPDRSRARRAAEASVVAGCVAVHVAVAFHDQLWPGPLSVADLVVLTLGAGAATSAASGAVLMTKGRRWIR